MNHRLLGFFALLLLASSLNAQTYCEPEANCVQDDYINNFSFNSIANNNSAGSNCGFWPFFGTAYINTGLSTNVTQGATYSFALGTNRRPQTFAIWVDWNDDGDFNDQDEFVWASSGSGTTFSGNITIPRKAQPGQTRMRVRSTRGTVFTSAQSCNNLNSGETEDYTLNIILNSQPPIADFNSNVTTATPYCDVQFFDQTQQYVAGWLWNFGDGTTSTLENPKHSYSTGGSYTVRLQVTNPNGTDTEVKTNYMTIGGTGLPAANCNPACSTILSGLGITKFDLGIYSTSSQDANAGYEDLSCSTLEVTQGENYNLRMESSQSVLQYYRMWVDWNGDGFISSSTELVFSQNNVQNASGNITIPATAALNTPLRVRLAGVYNLTAPSSFTPCSDLSNGQVEDHAIIIRPNTKPPSADFTSDVITTCDGGVEFEDLSSNVPSQWQWSFGDGGSSTAQNPKHTYASSGTYAVRLIAINSFGRDTLEKTSYVTVNLSNNVKPACTVNTLSHTADYGVHYVLIESLNKVSGGGEEGYQDYSCTDNLALMKQTKYPITIKVGDDNREDVRVWVDLNDDGQFANSELLIDSKNKNTHRDTLLIPSSAVTGNAVRMRVSSDFLGSNLGPCDNPTFGQVEDYSLTLSNNPDQVNADFEADSNISCTGAIQFTDLTTNNPDSWFWNFGDGNSSILQNPIHTYSSPGTYTVSLEASKSGVSDLAIRANFVHVVSSCVPDTLPESGNGAVLTACGGRIQDSGGNADYANNTNGIRTIAPSNALSLSLTFSIFDFENGVDFLKIYDGTDTNASLIGTYSGNTLPGGGTINSTGTSLTLYQMTNASSVASGFDATWACVSSETGPISFFQADSIESCKGLIQFTDLSVNSPTSWVWNFGDGGGSTIQNPLHQYINQGVYDVRLIATNAQGADTLLKTAYVNVSSAFCNVSVEEKLLESWKIYPNPCNGIIRIAPSQDFNGNASVEVMDLSGRIVQTELLNFGGEQQFHLKGLNSGSYLITLKSAESQSSKLIFYNP